MLVTYANEEIEAICTDAKVARRRYGAKMANKIRLQIGHIESVSCVDDLVNSGIGRCHPLKYGRSGEYAIDLVHPVRLIFEVYEETVLVDGKLETVQVVQVANVLEIVDYH